VIRWNPTGSQAADLEKEVEILYSLRHPRILLIVGVCRDMNPTEGDMGFIFEMMGGGSLYDCLHGLAEDAVLRRPADLISKLMICLDIADGMKFLHNSKILHRDLKSANVLIDGEGRCKIADFGLPTFKAIATQTPGRAASAWTDPEVIKGSKSHSEASDMYSYGVVVWEVFSGEIPWDRLPLTAIVSLTVDQGRHLENRETFPSTVKGFLDSSFQEWEQRPAFSSAFELFRDLLNDQRGHWSPRSSNTTVAQVVNSVMGQQMAPLCKAITNLESQMIGLRKAFGDMRAEILTLNNPDGVSGLVKFWTEKMEQLESLIRSPSCNEGEIVRELKKLGNSLANWMLDLDLKVDPDVMQKELTQARIQLVEAITAHNEEKISELLEELKRMLSKD
jgi:serine/threonine protein kinase